MLELSVHVIIAVAISVVACIWAYFRLSPSDSPTIQTGYANPLGDAEIIDGKAYI